MRSSWRPRERLLQIAVEAVIDVCGVMVIGLRLGLPGEEDDFFEKLEEASVISRSMKQRLREMKGFRNLLVHEYGQVDDRIVYEMMQTRLSDFEELKRTILRALRQDKGDRDPGDPAHV